MVLLDVMQTPSYSSVSFSSLSCSLNSSPGPTCVHAFRGRYNVILLQSLKANCADWPRWISQCSMEPLHGDLWGRRRSERDLGGNKVRFIRRQCKARAIFPTLLFGLNSSRLVSTVPAACCVTRSELPCMCFLQTCCLGLSVLSA